MRQEDLERLVREVLGDSYASFEVPSYALTEDLKAQKADIVCQLQRAGEGVVRSVEGSGVGLVDALFRGLKAALSDEYPSLNHIHFIQFGISGDFSKPGADRAQADAVGHVKLVVENTSKRQFTFYSDSRSISASSVDVVVKAVEHFVNAELAVLRIFDWIQDAKSRSRPDLADKYTQRLADLVQNASYSESIERKKQSLGM